MYKRILVAVDDSEGAWQALMEAVRLAGLVGEGVRLKVITVAGHPSWAVRRDWGALYDEVALRRALLAEGEALLGKVRDALQPLALRAETHLVDLTRQPGGSIAEAVLTEADSFGAELIVLGTHGRQGFRRLLLGSIAEHILRMTNRPVLLVKEGAAIESDQLPPALRDFSGRLFTAWPQSEYLSG